MSDTIEQLSAERVAKAADTITRRTTDELKQLALDIHQRRVFTDRHMRENDDLRQVFLLFNFMGEKPDATNWGMIYEYMEKAGPRMMGCGYPQFMSFSILHTDDVQPLFAIIDALRDAEKAALSAVLPAGGGHMSEPPSVIGATCEQLHQIDPAEIAPALRAAVAARCLAAGRSCFGQAKRAGSNGDAEASTNEGRAWMRERKRWLPPDPPAPAPTRRRVVRAAPTSSTPAAP